MHDDNFLESLAGANIDSFFADLKVGRTMTEAEKDLTDFQKSKDVDHTFSAFEDELQIAAASTARARPAPRLRSEHSESEPVWRPGDDPNFGLEKQDDGLLEKRHSKKMLKPARIEKSASGWVSEYDANGGLLRSYAAGVDRNVFAAI